MTEPPRAIRLIARGVIVVEDHLLAAFATLQCFHFLPGGGVEVGERAADALVRELGEEIGVRPEDVRDVRPLGALEHAWANAAGRFHELNLVFTASIAGLSPSRLVVSREPQVGFEWIGLERLGEIDLRPAPLRALLPAWRMAAAPWFQSAGL